MASPNYWRTAAKTPIDRNGNPISEGDRVRYFSQEYRVASFVREAYMPGRGGFIVTLERDDNSLDFHGLPLRSGAPRTFTVRDSEPLVLA